MSTKTKKPVNKKRMLNHVEELALKRIQIELDTQDTNGQAPPQYYTIRDFAHVYGDKLNDPDGIIIYNNYSGEPIMTFDIGEIEDESVIKKLINYIKENVDDMRESPTLQLLESQERHLATGLKVYDTFIEKDVVKNQFHDIDEFLAAVDFVVIMVKHNEIKENMDKLTGKVVLDCHNIINLPGVYHI